MLAGFQACHIPTMSTQRLDLPCSFSQKDGSRSQPVRPVGLSIEKPIVGGAKTTGCSLRQNIKLPPTPTEGKKDDLWEISHCTRKRYAADVSYDEENYTNRAKRKRAGNSTKEEEESHSSLGRLGSEGFWFHSGREEEERMCFMPRNITAPPLPPLSNIPWFDPVVTETTDLGKKNGGQPTAECPDKVVSGSSSSISDKGHDSVLEKLGVDPKEHECVELINLLVACVEQMGSRNVGAVNLCLGRLGEVASPRGTPVHRLAAYYTEALALRAVRLWPHAFHVTATHGVVEDESGTALRLLNEVSPIPMFVHFTSNEILLRAFEGKQRVHIIDFDIKQGLQWPSLFQSLASRTNPPSHVRVTGVGESKQELIETGDRLSGFAEALGLPFEFHTVVDRLEDVRLWMLHVKDGETVAVNCVFQMHRLLYDGAGGAVRDFLGLLRSTNAEVVVMAEQEADHDAACLDARLCKSLKYYSAIFDAVGSVLPSESPVRIKVEEMFGREIRSIIACEGRDRSERHRIFDKWQEIMEQGGFRCVGISERELLQGQMMLRMYFSCEGFGVDKKKGNGNNAECLVLSWLDQPLYSVSAWTPDDVAVSTFSRPS